MKRFRHKLDLQLFAEDKPEDKTDEKDEKKGEPTTWKQEKSTLEKTIADLQKSLGLKADVQLIPKAETPDLKKPPVSKEAEQQEKITPSTTSKSFLQKLGEFLA